MLLYVLLQKLPIIFTGPERYGDECCGKKISLLHFIVFFFLGGLTLLIVGVVQFKEEAGLHHARHHFLVGKIEARKI